MNITYVCIYSMYVMYVCMYVHKPCPTHDDEDDNKNEIIWFVHSSSSSVFIGNRSLSFFLSFLLPSFT